MSVKQENINRRDMLLIPPEEIVCDESLNGRWESHSTESISSLVKSFEQVGQIQPVTVRKSSNGKFQIVAGYRRLCAALAFNVDNPSNPMKIKCISIVMNDEDALRKNIVENKERKATSPMDDAVTQRRLREDFGWTNVRIAELYGVTPGYVSTITNLLKLSNDIQMKVHNGDLSVNAALALSSLPETEQKKAIAQVDEEWEAAKQKLPINLPAEHINTSAVLDKVRERKVSSGQKTPQRTLKEVKDFLNNLCSDHAGGITISIFETVLDFIAGKVSEKQAAHEIYELLEKEKI